MYDASERQAWHENLPRGEYLTMRIGEHPRPNRESAGNKSNSFDQTSLVHKSILQDLNLVLHAGPLRSHLLGKG